MYVHKENIQKNICSPIYDYLCIYIYIYIYIYNIHVVHMYTFGEWVCMCPIPIIFVCVKVSVSKGSYAQSILSDLVVCKGISQWGAPLFFLIVSSSILFCWWNRMFSPPARWGSLDLAKVARRVCVHGSEPCGELRMQWRAPGARENARQNGKQNVRIYARMNASKDAK